MSIRNILPTLLLFMVFADIGAAFAPSFHTSMAGNITVAILTLIPTIILLNRQIKRRNTLIERANWYIGTGNRSTVPHDLLRELVKEIE